MITLKWNRKGISSFEQKMKKLSDSISSNARLGLEDALKNIQKTALGYKRGKKDENLIPCVILEDNGKIITGRVYTDKTVFSFASFMEYGTGIYAEREHIGTTKTFIESGYTYWLLPESKSERAYGPERTIIINEKKFYIMYPQEPNPFMRTTAFQTRSETIDIIKNKLKQGVREVILK